MKTCLLLCCVVLALCSGCASVAYDPREEPAGSPMTGSQARAAIEQSLDQVAFAKFFDRSVRKISYSSKGITFFTLKPDGKGLEYFLPYATAEKLRLVSSVGDYLAEAPGTTTDLPWNFVWKEEQPGRDFVRAARSLAVAARTGEENAAASVDSFQKIAEEYRRSPKREFPEVAQRFKVLAERAFKERNYLDAIEYFGSALEAAPWWPEGHFNRALLLGQQRNFGQAVAEMKKYLLLVPDPPNAKEVKEKIFYWEGQLGK